MESITCCVCVCVASILDGLQRNGRDAKTWSPFPASTWHNTCCVALAARQVDRFHRLPSLFYPQALTNLRRRRCIFIALVTITVPIAICAYFIQNSRNSLLLHISLHLILDNIHSNSWVLNSREKWQLPPCWAGVLCRRWLGFPRWGLRRWRLTPVARSLQDWRCRVHSFTRSRDGEAWLCPPSKRQTLLL